MRRIFILLTMAVAAITACTKASSDLEEERINPESATYTYTITANNGMPEVKTNYDSDGSFKWSDGDAISVLFHNSDAEVKNKFFTLTLVSGANTNTATFSGEIENGYTIGASDGTEADKKIWALFPASDNHSYTEGSNPSFYVQPFVDFTATHFSANIPMYALNQEEGALNFSNLTCTYKFIVKGIKTGVTKVQCTVSNAAGLRDLSGSSEIKDDGYGHVYINYNWTRSGLTFISNVTNNQAVFYIPCRFYAEFQPTVTITNYDTGVDIKTFTANKAQQPVDMTSVKPITLDISNGEYFTPKIFINGDFADWAALSDNYVGISAPSQDYQEFKVTYDELYLYFYSKRNLVRKSDWPFYIWYEIDTNSDGTYDKRFYFYPYSNDLTLITNPQSNNISGLTLSCADHSGDNFVEFETRIPRSELGIVNGSVLSFQSTINKVNTGSTLTIASSLTISDGQ